MTATYYRVQDASHDPAQLLDSATWASRVWGGVAYRICPTCHGYPQGCCDTCCDTCCGVGEIEDTRYGVSACRDLDDLYRYFGARMGAGTITGEQLAGCVLVAMLADVATDDDHDDAEGLSILVWPRSITSVSPIGPADIPEHYLPQ